MGIYLGNYDLLGGGGGGIPIGGYAFFQTPVGVSFTSGKEVYTDADGLVWIKTGARITSADSGTLNASLYSNAELSLSQTSTTYTGGGGYAFRFSSGYNGVHLFDIGLYNGSNAGYYTIKDSDGTSVTAGVDSSGPFSATVDATGWVAHSAFFNDTHAFTPFYRSGINSFGIDSATHRFAYVPFTSFTGGTNGYSQTNWFSTPQKWMAVTHIQTSPRYWGVANNGTTVTEYTFNASATNGTNPFTATTNTFTLVGDCDKFTTDGVDKLYVQTGSTLREYDVNGTVTNTFSGLPSAYNSWDSTYGFSCVPSFKNSAGVTQFWMTTSYNDQNNNGYHTVTRYDLIEVIEGPYTGSSSSKVLVQMQDTDSNDIFDNGSNVYLWKRIA